VKLVIAELRALRRYVSREFSYILGGLIEDHRWRQLDPFDLRNASGSMEDRLLRELGEIPEVVLFWEGYELLIAHAQAFQEMGCKKYIFADDLHWWNDQMRAVKTLGFSCCDGILCAYEPAFHRFYPRLSQVKEVVWIPHAASPDFLLEYNESPEPAVFLSGAINHHYPLRQAMLRLHQGGDLHIVRHEHPGYHCGYDYELDGRIGRAYAERIREHLAGFTDCLTFGYTVAKHFEIPATGSFLVADAAVEEDLARLGFEAGIHYIPVTPSNLERRLAYVLDPRHREEIDVIRRRGQELVRERHTTRHRSQRIDEVCK